jgi:hypothetical protein
VSPQWSPGCRNRKCTATHSVVQGSQQPRSPMPRPQAEFSMFSRARTWTRRLSGRRPTVTLKPDGCEAAAEAARELDQLDGRWNRLEIRSELADIHDIPLAAGDSSPLSGRSPRTFYSTPLDPARLRLVETLPTSHSPLDSARLRLVEALPFPTRAGSPFPLLHRLRPRLASRRSL